MDAKRRGAAFGFPAPAAGFSAPDSGLSCSTERGASDPAETEASAQSARGGLTSPRSDAGAQTGAVGTEGVPAAGTDHPARRPPRQRLVLLHRRRGTMAEYPVRPQRQQLGIAAAPQPLERALQQKIDDSVFETLRAELEGRGAHP